MIKSEKRFRPEIEGLRAIAALLVAVYHIWLGTVSGGVDVFFIVSGFLITTSLISRMDKYGEIKIFDFLLGLMKRLFPIAFFIMFFIVVASIIWLPEVRWGQTVQEAFASIFYYENWQLAFNATDYLGQNNEASPFQHYWALSIQGQFYILWSLLFLIVAFISKTIFKKSYTVILLWSLVVIFFISLSYSIYITIVNQPWAYFNTFARVWEFSMGGILAITLPYFSLKKSINFFLGWAGLAIITTTGLLLPVSNIFPGYAALIPTLGAVAVMVASTDGGKYGVHKLLASKPMMKLGSFSYAIYLWHWPILIFYFINTGFTEVSISHGLLIILISIFLSYLSTIFIEKPVRKINHKKNPKKSFLIVLILMVPTILFSVFWNETIQDAQSTLSEQFSIDEYPGATALIHDIPNDEDKGFIPEPLQARDDLPKVYEDNCHQAGDKSEVIECAYGELENYDYEVALVGGSHSAHWLPALEEISKMESIKIYSITMSGCRYSTQNENGELSEECLKWSENVDAHLADLKPDLVFTTANVSDDDFVEKGFIEKWKMLSEKEIDVFAVRDNPWLDFDGPTCVEENKENLEKCSVAKNDVLSSNVPWEGEDSVYDNVTFADLTDAFCGEEKCDAVVGNILIYRDSHHITETYAKTLAPVLHPELMEALK